MNFSFALTKYGINKRDSEKFSLKPFVPRFIWFLFVLNFWTNLNTFPCTTLHNFKTDFNIFWSALMPLLRSRFLFRRLSVLLHQPISKKINFWLFITPSRPGTGMKWKNGIQKYVQKNTRYDAMTPSK